MSYDRPSHRQSQALAAKDVRLRMIGHRNAAPSLAFEGTKQLIYSSLERIGTLLAPDKQPTFYSIAIDLLPIGSFNAYACVPEHQPPYVLIDTGMFDFFGNLSA